MNISKIESFMNGLITGISENIFFNDFPSTTSASWTDAVVVNCENAISDLNGCGKGTINVYLYAKKNPSGSKSLKNLTSMEQKLNECIKSNTNRNYIVNRFTTYTGEYDEERNMFCNIVVLNILIV